MKGWTEVLVAAAAYLGIPIWAGWRYEKSQHQKEVPRDH